ncbi:hypothetical protein FB451DRAFT_626723 [Mycena latifolia]|nr:hypothetical protein FB451DRAFT_626723 [Mycena latifolia]
MVLTLRVSTAIYRGLPNEIITEIIVAALQTDRASLCRVSQLFHALCLPVLYGVVRLETHASAVAFCSAIISNSALAALVRSLTVASSCFPITASRLSRLLADSSKSLLRVEILSIDLMLLQDGHLRELLACTFPHLVQCSLGTKERHWNSTEREDTLASFLTRHPALTKLRIQDWIVRESSPSVSPRIPLQHLKHLSCPIKFVPSIAASNLKEARLYWDVDNIECTISALKSMTRPNEPFVCSNDVFAPIPFSDIVDSISKNIPHIKTLHLRLYQLHSLRGTLDNLRTSLSRFTGLAYLSIEYVLTIDSQFLGDTEAGEQLIVQGFGDVCPTLEACRFYSRAWRKVDNTWELCHAENFKALSCIP